METRPINYAASYIVCNFVLVHGVFSERLLKVAYKLDHNVAPRQDLDKYAAAAVKKGKIDQKTLDMMKRSEAANKNALDHLPFFFVTMIFAIQAGLPTDVINTFGAAYTVTRVAYFLAYVSCNSNPWSYIRSALWWMSNIACFATLYQCGQAINA